MAQITAISLLDGASTPVPHSFTPMTAQMGTNFAVWLNREAATPIGWRKIQIAVVTKTNGVSKVRVKISDPILATVQPGCCIDQNSPVLSYTDLVEMTFNVPFQSSLQNRKDLLAFAKNLLSDATMVNAVTLLEPAF